MQSSYKKGSIISNSSQLLFNAQTLELIWAHYMLPKPSSDGVSD